jgi:molybdopterin converting factor small subunit
LFLTNFFATLDEACNKIKLEDQMNSQKSLKTNPQYKGNLEEKAKENEEEVNDEANDDDDDNDEELGNQDED